MKKRSRVAGLAVAALLCASLVSAGEEDPLLEKKAPDFKLMDDEGKELSLARFTGKVIVLNFWRTTCFPCIEEMPDLEKLYKEYKDKGVVLIGVAVNDKMSDVDNKVNVLGITYPVALDNMATRLEYRIRSVPHTFIIDKGGTIRAHFDKKTDKKALEEAIKPLLDEKPVEAE